MAIQRGLWRAVSVAVQVGALALLAPSVMAQTKPPIESGANDPDSLVHANEFVVPPGLCRALGFVPGSAQLSTTTPRVITAIHKQWRKAPRDRNDLVLVVLPDAGLAPAAASRQANQRAATLARALVRSGIAKSDVFVRPQPGTPSSVALSCPPVR